VEEPGLAGCGDGSGGFGENRCLAGGDTGCSYRLAAARAAIVADMAADEVAASTAVAAEVEYSAEMWLGVFVVQAVISG